MGKENKDGHRRPDQKAHRRSTQAAGGRAGGTEDTDAAAEQGTGEGAGEGGVAQPTDIFSKALRAAMAIPADADDNGDSPNAPKYKTSIHHVGSTQGPSKWHTMSNSLGPSMWPVPPQRKMPPSEGVRVGEIEGWRCWWVIVGNEGLLLRSMVMPTFWSPWQPLECPHMKSENHVEPCGIYAWKDSSAALYYARDATQWLYAGYVDLPVIRRIAIGRVALWGDVVEHERGYRAEFAKPISIWSVINDDESLCFTTALRDVYGVGE